MLKDSQIRELKAKDKDYKVSDSNKLWIYVTTNKVKSWRFRYRYLGKSKQVVIGKYPFISAKEAREIRDEYETMLAHGQDPASHKKSEKIKKIWDTENTFQFFADALIKHKKESQLSPDYIEKIEGRLKNYLNPEIGNLPLSEITPQHVVALAEKIHNAGNTETANRCKSIISQVFEFSTMKGLNLPNPVTALPKRIVPSKKTKHMATITQPEKIGELLRSFDAFTGYIVVKTALLMAPHVFLRPGELRQLEWSEINWDEKRIYISKEKLKSDCDLIVPLSRQVMKLLKNLHPSTSKSRYIFPGIRSNKSPMSDGAINAALKRLGWETDKDITGHGFRAMARTVIRERLKLDREHIEMQLNHVVLDPLGRAYNRADFIEDRTEMMQKWSDYLDELKCKK